MYPGNIANRYISLAGETDECDITTPIAAQQWLPYIVVFSLRALGKDFSLNASFTACCSGSTKSIQILNRKQRMKRVREKERQGVGPVVVRSPGRAFLPSQANCQRLWSQAEGKGLISVYRDVGSLDSGVLDLGEQWERASKYSLEGS